MEFKILNQLIKTQFTKMTETGMLFRVGITGSELWSLYLESYEDPKVFRDPESNEHNCNHCNNFIKRYGNVVAIKDGEILTMFDVEATGEYFTPMRMLSDKLKSLPIQNVFFESIQSLSQLGYGKVQKGQEVYQLGLECNHKRYTQEEAEKFGVVKKNEIRTFHHFNVQLPKQFVIQNSKSIESVTSSYRDKYNVFKRCMEEIPVDTLILVRDLINQGSLLDGTAHLHAIEDMIVYKNGYEDLKVMDDIDLLLWKSTYKMEERVAKFKNTLIGVLCSELAEGMDLNKACLNWNKRVDPANYHKATAPITQRQIGMTKEFVIENGYEDSFNRRLATIDDIKADEIKYLNSGDGSIESVSIFDNVKATSTKYKKAEYENVEEVSIEKFMKDILPGCSNLEVLLKNNHEGNMVALTTSNIETSKPIFKWNNNYSWTFNGNLAGKSQIKENVKAAGGKVEGLLRCSLQWNDKDTKGMVDFDLHCETKTNRIYYSNKGRLHRCGGKLDVDMVNPRSIGIENIFWANRIEDGVYEFKVKNYNGFDNNGFKIEITFGNESFTYHKTGNVKGVVKIAKVTVKNGEFDIEHSLPEINSSKNLWGLDTNEFHKVNLVCLSPNHWGDNEIGNKHYMFMLDKCKSPNQIRGFHNENLIPGLLEHRKVMEVLGSQSMIKSTDKQLSGVGFNSTVKDELIVKVSGSHKRILKICF